MSMTSAECVKMIEKQIEFAVLGFCAEVEGLLDDLKESGSLQESYDTVIQIRAAVDAMEDMFEQLADVTEEAKMMSEMEANAKEYEFGEEGTAEK